MSWQLRACAPEILVARLVLQGPSTSANPVAKQVFFRDKGQLQELGRKRLSSPHDSWR